MRGIWGKFKKPKKYSINPAYLLAKSAERIDLCNAEPVKV